MLLFVPVSLHFGMESELWKSWEFWEDTSSPLQVFISLCTLPLTLPVTHVGFVQPQIVDV